MMTGHIYTVAGWGDPVGALGDGGPAIDAALNSPLGVAVDANDNVLIADTGNNRVRVVATSTANVYGVAMTAGHIYTIAGTGTAGIGGSGVQSPLNSPVLRALSSMGMTTC